jgi:DHA2 family multidrug resistance protein
MFFVPVNTVAFSTLPPHYRGDATAFTSLMRKIGSSVGVSILVGQYIRGAQENHAWLSTHLTPYTETLRHAPLPDAWSLSNLAGLAALDKEVLRQAQFLSYLHDFQYIAVVIIALMPLILLIENPMKDGKK